MNVIYKIIELLNVKLQLFYLVLLFIELFENVTENCNLI